MTTLTCKKCNQILPVERFYKASGRSGRKSCCIPCYKAAYAARRSRLASRADPPGPEPVAFFRLHDVWPIYPAIER